MSAADVVLGRRVDPRSSRIFKFVPSSPPCRGEHILVNNERCRVTYCRVRWEGRRWTIMSLRVKPDPL